MWANSTSACRAGFEAEKVFGREMPNFLTNSSVWLEL